MRVRSSEIDAIVSLLEKEDFEDAQEMAKAILNLVRTIWEKREFHGIKWGYLAYGPFIDKAEANQRSRRLADVTTVHTMLSVAQIDDIIVGLDPESKTKCPECPHPKFAHPDVGKHHGCLVKGCKCTLTHQYPKGNQKWRRGL